MEIFLTLIFKLIPFYIFILLGLLAGKVLRAQKETLASILIYMIQPVIVFHGALISQISVGTLSLPFIFFAAATLICISTYQIVKNIWHDSTKNILAFTAGSGNVGYFGLPVAVSIFGEQALSLVTLVILGSALYENTIGFFITARGHHSAKESLIKVATLPSVYAFLLGIFINLLQIKMGAIYLDTVMIFRGSYTLLGMMLIGLGLSGITKYSFDLKFISFAFVTRFLIWPVLILFIIFIDANLFKFYDSYIHNILILMSIVPLAANTVAYATALRAQPEKASLAVLLSTLFALFYIPLVISLFGLTG